MRSDRAAKGAAPITRAEARPSEPPRRAFPGDRYEVTSLTGYPMTLPNQRGDGGGRRTTEWYVIDTVYCCRVVARFTGLFAQIKAYARADRLNADERRWEASG